MALNKRDTSKTKDWIVSTIGGVLVSKHPYETAISHIIFRKDREWALVAEYDTEQEALAGHAHWLAILRSGKLPSKLVDVSTSETCLYADKEIGNSWRKVKFLKKPVKKTE